MNRKQNLKDAGYSVNDAVAFNVKQIRKYIDISNLKISILDRSSNTYQDIYNALVYWYEVKENANNPNVAHGGIGIVKYVMDESKQYWDNIQSIKDGLKGKSVQDSIHTIKVSGVRPMEDVYRPKLFQLG